jgi:O-antigen ligase
VFGVVSSLLVFLLLSFGGVLRHSWLTVEIAWILSAGLMLVYQFVKRRSVDSVLIAFIVSSGLIALTAQPKISVGLMCAGWAYVAASHSTPKKILRFFHFLLMVGILEAVLGLVQYFLFPGWILGYHNTSYITSGTLINRNHFAGLLEMFIPVSLGLAYMSSRRFSEVARPYLYLLAGAVMGLTLIFSLSRMGIFSFLTTVFFLAMVLQLPKSQRRASVALGFGMLTLVLVGAFWIGIDGIVQRYSELIGQDAILHEGRVVVYRDALRMIGANPAGVGTGNFQDRFRQYQTYRPDLLFDHAHNDYLETAAEWGLPLAAAFWSFLFFIVIRGVRLFVSIESPEQRGILLACTGAIFSILVHSFTDFNLQIPSNAMLFFTFVGISLALPLPEEEPRKPARHDHAC